MARSNTYVWQHEQWPELTFDIKRSAQSSRQLVCKAQWKGRPVLSGMDRAGEVAAEVLAQEVMATAAIEGEKLDAGAVRSSVMRHLGLADTGPLDRHVDGLVEVISDAVTAFQLPLDHDRLHRWQSALFPGGTHGITRIAVGRYRTMPIPCRSSAAVLAKRRFTTRPRHPPESPPRWTGSWSGFPHHASQNMDGLARAAVAHVWFEKHPPVRGRQRPHRACHRRHGHRAGPG